jgi:hypothetical protein
MASDNKPDALQIGRFEIEARTSRDHRGRALKSKRIPFPGALPRAIELRAFGALTCRLRASY